MDILKSNLTGTLCPLIETNDRYIMQGQVYGKEDMKFEFMNFLPVNSHECLSDLSVIRRTSHPVEADLFLERQNRRCRGDMYIVDNKDPNITYCITNSILAQSYEILNSRIVKFRKNETTNIVWNEQIKTKYSTSSIGSVRATVVEILGQNDDYILVVAVINSYSSYSSSRGDRTNQHCVIRINKTTGDSTFVFHNGSLGGTCYGNTIKKVYETEFDIYFYFHNGVDSNSTINGVKEAQSQVFRYEKNSNTIHSVGDINDLGIGNVIYCSEGFMKNGYIFFYAYLNVCPAELKLIKIDTISNETIVTNPLCTFNNKVTSIPSSISNTLSHHSRIAIELFLKEYEGKKYLNVIGYSTDISHSDPEFNRITTFLIDEENDCDLIAQDYCDPFNNSAIRGFVEMIDENLLLVTNKIATKVLKFDILAGKYVDIKTIAIPNTAIGCDSKNNIWITDTSNEIHKFSPEIPVDVKLSFENEKINYVGQDVNNNILIEAIDYLNKRAVVELELTIKGNMVFEDGTRIAKVKTSAKEKISIPVIVKGSGVISVFPKILL